MTETMNEEKKVAISRLTDAHLDGVAHIESCVFAEPWSKNSLANLSVGGSMGVGFVACDATSETVVGYVGMVTVLDEGQITNVAVLPEYRGQGVGRRLLAALTDYAKEVGLSEITLEVRPSNRPAIRLYESFGFETVGKRKNFYAKPQEDALIQKWRPMR